MPSLSDKLKSLGVKVGAEEIERLPDLKQNHSLDEVLNGQIYHTQLGATYIVEQVYSGSLPHGTRSLQSNSPLDALADWAGDSRIRSFSEESFAFLDTETTGLSGGTGTYAFLIGAGRFIDGKFQLLQLFMRDPVEEPAQLYALEEFLAPCQGLVTYNGKSFDIPLLVSRYTTHGWQTPLLDYAHVDLLHLCRRLWRDRLPSRTLGNIEAHILGAQRSQDDVPGWMIPQLYFDYLRSGNAEPLRSVFYHNAMDVVSLAALLAHTSGVLSDPLAESSTHGVDLLSLARLFEDMGHIDSATRLYIHGLDHPDILEGGVPEEIIFKSIERLALIYKRQHDFDSALPLWQGAANHGHIESHIELAKYYEHHAKDLEQALHWTELALSQLDASEVSNLYTLRWQPEIEHRRQRLLHKGAPG